jgi:hypothetical protein
MEGLAEIISDFFNSIDPTRTLAVHRSNGFDADFSPYQSNRLRR